MKKILFILTYLTLFFGETLSGGSPKLVGEYRFDNCYNDEWRTDYSFTENNITGDSNISIPSDDGKAYMEDSIYSYEHTDLRIPHHPNYEIDEGTISILLHDHHNISTYKYNILKKGNLKIETVQVDSDNKKGSIKVTLNGNIIDTREVYWTTKDLGDNLDTEWIHITFTFGLEGMKLYINGELKGSNSYTGGVGLNKSDFILPDISGYYDELYIFENQAPITKVQELYTNTLNNINIDGSIRDWECKEDFMISIDDVTKKEGESGATTDFVFTVSFNKSPVLVGGIKFKYQVFDGNNPNDNFNANNPEDYIADNFATTVVLEGSDLTYNITVKVKNDTKMEETEQFYIKLTEPFNAQIADNIGIGTIVNDDMVLFNVERINSDTVDNATQYRKETLYTQIVGRDFHYALISYDKNQTNDKEIPIEDVTLKVELIDINSSKELYKNYIYFNLGTPKSRLKIELADDLNLSTASRDARFRISYIYDSNGSIVKGQYDNAIDYNSTKVLYSENNTTYSRDNFAIRPETFYMIISDGGMTRKINRDGLHTPLKLASGYDYNLTIVATQYRKNHTIYPSLDYNRSIGRLLEFGENGSCSDDSNISQNEEFRDGKNITSLLEHDNVGLYTLKLRDSDWTMVDWNKTTPDCTTNQSYTSDNGNEMSGCIVASHSDLNLSFYPDHFALNLNMQNMPDSGHPNFLYMSELNSTYSHVGIGFQGTIVAQSEDNKTTSNFTSSCVATNLLLNLDTTTISVEGTNQLIHTNKGSIVNFSRLISFNKNITLDFDNTLQEINSTVDIDSNRFLDDNNGTVDIDMRYNINKHLTEPINPVEVSFHGIRVSSSDANSIAHDKVNINSNKHTPIGAVTFANNRKNFYFARVVSDLHLYPEVNLQLSSVLRTPLNVDIFCSTNIVNYCEDREILNNTNLTGTTREQTGWYLSSSHNAQLDGNVTSLIGSNTPPIVSINPNSNITLPNGENGMIMVRFNECSSPQSTITITTDPPLVFEPSEYVVSCRDSNTSWTGVGQTGNILNVKPKGNGSGKMEW